VAGCSPARLFLPGGRMSLAGVLVFCRVSDSRSPAIAWLLVVGFLTSPMASRGRGPEKTVGIARGDRQFPVAGSFFSFQRKRTVNRNEKRRCFWGGAAIFHLGPLSFKSVFGIVVAVVVAVCKKQFYKKYFL